VSFGGIASILVTLLIALLVLIFNENLKELFRALGWNAFFVNYWQTWRSRLHLANLRGLWWLWLGFGVAGGIVLTVATLWLIALFNPPVKWLSVLTAIDTFAPADLKREFDDAGQQYKDKLQQANEMQQEIDVDAASPQKAQSPEFADLRRRHDDIVRVSIPNLQTRRVNIGNKITENLRNQLKSGTLVAKAYDQDKREEVSIPTEEWEFLRLSLFGEPLQEIGIAGGAGKSLTGVLIGTPP
jgi:hypothetical protein